MVSIMKICVVSNFSDNHDEGLRNVAKSYFVALKKKYDVKKVSYLSISDLLFLRQFNPSIIHLVLSPTIFGLLLAKIISLVNYKSKVIISAINCSVPEWRFLWILKFFKVDLVLVQTKETENFFNSLGYPTKFLFNSVDIDKFRPVNGSEKEKLRLKYQIPLDKFVILHVASVTRQRNLEMLMEMQDKKNQVLIIGRETWPKFEKIDFDIIERLREKGCKVWLKHFPNIEEIYNISDCYLFPSKEKNACIETPLSVLEAMACNLPVITTNFGSLPNLFKEENGLFFVEEPKDIAKVLENINDVNVNNREKILPFAVNNFSRDLVNLYGEVLNN
jgi:glycosyltransferase involved in cell wall biosynthesis